MGQTDITCLLIRCTEKVQPHFYDIPACMHYVPEANKHLFCHSFWGQKSESGFIE